MLFRIFTVLAVAALAVSTWILSSPARPPGAAAAGGMADLPGYYLKNAVLTDFDAAGAPSLHLRAERIDQVGHGTEVTLSTVRVDYQTQNAQTWVLFGDYARVEPGGKVIDVNSNVRLTGVSGAHAGTAIVLTDVLRYDVAESIVSTRSDVRIVFGAHTLTGRGLTANLKDQTLHLDSKVNGRFQR